jgi:hypothetical protein
MSEAQDQEPVLLRLTRAQAVVLFEWLTRVDSAGGAPVMDPSETYVLWQLEAQLESVLVEPLRSDYLALLEAARKMVRESEQ